MRVCIVLAVPVPVWALDTILEPMITRERSVGMDLLHIQPLVPLPHRMMIVFVHQDIGALDLRRPVPCVRQASTKAQVPMALVLVVVMVLQLIQLVVLALLL